MYVTCTFTEIQNESDSIHTTRWSVWLVPVKADVCALYDKSSIISASNNPSSLLVDNVHHCTIWPVL